MVGRVESPEMLLLRSADTVATVEGQAGFSAEASCSRGAGVHERGMSSRDRREPGRPCRFRGRRKRAAMPNERLVMVGRESEWSMVPVRLGNRDSSGPSGGTGPPEEEAR